MRIVLFADSRWRDSFGLALVKYWIHQLDPDAEVYTPSFDLWQVALEGIKPDAVVLNHAFGQRNKEILKWARRNRATSFLMFTEGRPNSDSQVEWYKGQAGKSDYILSWSDWLSSFFDNAITTGSPRFDIYQEPYKSLIEPRLSVLDRYGLPPNRDTVLIATSFPQAKFAYQNVNFNKADWKDLDVVNIEDRTDPLLFSQMEVAARHEFKVNVAYNISMMGKNLNVIVKPHPMESMSDWQRYCDDNGFLLIQHDYIFNLINAADLVVNRAGCLTSQDSWLLNKTAAQIKCETDVLTGSSLEAFECKTDTDTSSFLDKYGFAFPNSGRTVASVILEKTTERNINRTFQDLTKYQVAQANYDNQHAYPNIGMMHPFKAVTSNVIKNWELSIKDLLDEQRNANC